MAQHTPRTGRIELRTIDFVPESERHGKAWHQFTLWFGANSVIVSVVTASLLVSAGMNLGWSILAVVIGMGLGAFFSAFHAAQGPKLGIPQMIQSRAQFGYVGGAMPMGIALVNYLVFFAGAASPCNPRSRLLCTLAEPREITIVSHGVLPRLPSQPSGSSGLLALCPLQLPGARY